MSTLSLLPLRTSHFVSKIQKFREMVSFQKTQKLENRKGSPFKQTEALILQKKQVSKTHASFLSLEVLTQACILINIVQKLFLQCVNLVPSKRKRFALETRERKGFHLLWTAVWREDLGPNSSSGSSGLKVAAQNGHRCFIQTSKETAVRTPVWSMFLYL